MKCLSCQNPDGKNLIVVTEFWSVTLSSNQSYLGRSYVTLKRHCGSLSELEPNEWLDFIDLIKKLESAFKKAFDATMFNYTCLMNNAYQESPPNPHVHWHFRPRYDHSVDVGGEQFNDPEFGHHYSREREQSTSPEVKEVILSKIKESV